MAIWNDLPHRDAVLNAAAEWRKSCFFGDGALFSHESIWTLGNVKELQSWFADFQFGGHRDFFEKLDSQIESASPDVIHLTAEIVWLIYLFPLGIRWPGGVISVGIARKREKVLHYLDMAGDYPQKIHLFDVRNDGSYLLSDAVLGGLARTGPAYNRKRYDMFAYFLQVMVKWKALPDSEQRQYAIPLSSWRFAEWLDRIPPAGGVPLRHALLHLLYPDDFERIVSTRHKRDIVKAFKPDLPDRWAIPNHVAVHSAFSELTVIDADLYNIRQFLEQQHGPEIDFYLPPLAGRWQKQDKPQTEPEQIDLSADIKAGGHAMQAQGEVIRPDAQQLPADRMVDPSYHHAEVLQRIADLELGLDRLEEDRQQPVVGIGHNHPPDDTGLLAEIRNDIGDIRRDLEILKSRPVELPSPEDQNEVLGAAARLERRGTFWRNSLGDIFVDNFAATAGQEAGRWFVRIVAGMLISVAGAAITWTLSAIGALPI